MTIEELTSYKDKLESLTQKTNGCWWFNGTKDKTGRGTIKVGKKTKNASTLSWEISNGELLPEGFMLKNSCENRACINPAHLELSRRTFPWRL